MIPSDTRLIHILLIICILFSGLSLLPEIGFAMKNPSAVYCTGLGYLFSIENTPAGEIGQCTLPNNLTVSAWKFIQGEEGLNYTYCRQKGYDQKVIHDATVCQNAFADSCVVCIVGGNQEVEATKLMNLSYNEAICGDGICGFGEKYGICPQDCPSGSWDGYCDRVKDNICDPDCVKGEDPDCPMLVELQPTTPAPVAATTTKASPGFEYVAAAAAFAAMAFGRRKN